MLTNKIVDHSSHPTPTKRFIIALSAFSMPIFFTISALAAPLNSESASSLEGRYRINSIQCKLKQVFQSNCEHGEEIEISISKTARGKVILLQELKDGKALREWRLTNEQTANEQLTINNLLTESSDSLSYSEFRAVPTGGESLRRLTRTSLSLLKEGPSEFRLKVNRSEELEKLMELEALSDTELSFNLTR